MSIMIGFGKHRMELLQKELDRIAKLVPQLGVQRVILLNPLYPGAVDRDTSLKLVMVMEDDRPFVRRPDFFYNHLSPGVAVEFIPLTPQELDSIEQTESHLRRSIRLGEVIYDG